jgi:hypothetical protein
MTYPITSEDTPWMDSTKPKQFTPDGERDMFLDAMKSMTAAAQEASEALKGLFGASVATAPALVRAVLHVHRRRTEHRVRRLKHLRLQPQREAADDAIWECQALALRLEPKVFEATYTMFGTASVNVKHRLFSRDVVVEAYTVASSYAVQPGTSNGLGPMTVGLSSTRIPDKEFHVHVTGVNDVQIQFVGSEFRKPPYQFTMAGSRSGATPARVRIKVMA